MFFVLLCLSMTALISAGLCRILIRIAPRDNPDNGRKQQRFAVPTSGGTAIVLALCLASLGLSLYQGFIANRPIVFAPLMHQDFIAITAFCLYALCLGAWDDRQALPVKPRLMITGFLLVLLTAFGPSVTAIFVPFLTSATPVPIVIAVLGTALWIFVIMNGVNFIDGSNGLAMGLLAIMLGGLALRFHNAPDLYTPGLVWLCALSIAAILGFLYWNLQGKLYAGDAGALFGGTWFACLAVLAAQDGNIWFVATLGLPILVDVFLTLIWRLRHKQNLLQPHRHHAYQLLSRAGWGHIQIALLYWAIAFVCAGLALIAAHSGPLQSFAVFMILLISLSLIWALQRRAHRIPLP